jgi:hypothetical protein
VLQRYSISELARATGLPRRTLYFLRCGKVQNAQLETLLAIKRGLARSDACGVSSLRHRSYGYA